MKIIVIGTRGIPNIQGGVETHCQELYPRIVENGNHEVTIILRSCYVKDVGIKSYKGINLKTIYAPQNKNFEAIIHTFLSILYAAYIRPDIVHIHAIGPNLFAPLGRLLGLKVVMTHHGPDYQRKKWGKMAKKFLMLGEKAGIRFANAVIVISKEIQNHVESRYKRSCSSLIPNGVPKVSPDIGEGHLHTFNVKRRGYIFTLGRFVPEKGFDYLVNAYLKSRCSSTLDLVIAGDADHETSYSRQFKELAKKNGIITPGFVKGDVLAQLFANARAFILPSFYEGLPISLLEAMSYRLPILASNIPANTQVGLPDICYFKVGDETSLIDSMDNLLSDEGLIDIDYDLRRYDWDEIAIETIRVYEKILG